MVTGTTAQVAFEADANFFFGGVGNFFEQTCCCHHHSGCAESALQAMILHERLLHRVQRAVSGGHAFDRGDLGSVGLHCEYGATLHGFAVEMDAARTTRRGVTADIGAGQPDVSRSTVIHAVAGAHWRART